MARTRCRCPGWLALVAACATAACSGPSSGGSNGDDDVPGDGSLPGFDAPPPAGLFPLGVSSDGTTLVTSDGQPFLIHGEAAWSLIAQLSTSDAMRYLADRRGRGINAILVNLIEHYYADHAPNNAAGDAPFTDLEDFSTTKEPYFAHADQVIDMAASQGMAVMLFPSYLGFQLQEGWRDEMMAMGSVAGAPKCASYGQFVGHRFAGKKNIIWMWGGDDLPTQEPAVEACMEAIRDGIVAAAPGTLTSAHWAPPSSTSRDEKAFADSIKIVGVYDYHDDLQDTCRNTRNAAPRMPTFMIESCYEGEAVNNCSMAASEARRRQFWGWLGCGAGQIYGIGGLWQFSANWQSKLGSPVTVSAQRLLAIAQLVTWNTLAPDTVLVTAGGGDVGSEFEVVAARTADHKQAVIYVPPGTPTTGILPITVDLGQLSGAVTATWQDPTADHSIAAGDGLTGSHVFTRPAGNNSGGDADWVLVLTVR
jgi:hypothetical protein